MIEAVQDWLQIPSQFSRIAERLWMGAAPYRTAPREFDVIVNLHPWAEYEMSPRQILIKHWMRDADELPEEKTLNALADFVNIARTHSKVLVHCQMGLNRSGLVCALALIRDGVAPEDAIERLRKQRHPSVLCNSTFEKYLLGLRSVG